MNVKTAERPRIASMAYILALCTQLIPAVGATGSAQEALEIRVGPQTVVMEDAIFPYMTTTREGTIIVVGTVLRPNPRVVHRTQLPAGHSQDRALHRRRQVLGTLVPHGGTGRRTPSSPDAPSSCGPAGS